MIDSSDTLINRKPQLFSNYKQHSFSLEIYNNTNNEFKLKNITFPKKAYLNLSYDKNTQKFHKTMSNGIKIQNSKINDLDLNDLFNMKISSCKINREFIENIKNLFINTPDQGLSIILESQDDQSSIKLSIFNETDGYKIEILQTSSEYIDLAPRNIHKGIDIFSCYENENSLFIEELSRFIIYALK